MTEDEIVGWHHRLDGHEFEQAPGDGDGQGSLVCCSSWGHKESDMTEQLNNNSAPNIQSVCILFVCFLFWPCSVVYGILVPQTGFEPKTSAMK